MQDSHGQQWRLQQWVNGLAGALSPYNLPAREIDWLPRRVFRACHDDPVYLHWACIAGTADHDLTQRLCGDSLMHGGLGGSLVTICTCGIDWLPQSRKLLLPCSEAPKAL